MAAKYLRRLTWWVRLYHPRTGELVRGSLDTHDEARAELLRQRIELQATLLEPRFQAVEIPSTLCEVLGATPPAPVEPPFIAPSLPSVPQGFSAVPANAPDRALIDTSLARYIEFIRIENAPLHVQGKLSMLRRFLGGARVDRIAEVLPGKKNQHPARGAYFEGEFLDQVTPAVLQQFLETMQVSRKTKRHYREMFHHFFKFCINCGLYQPTNFHCPNPVVALPSYLSRNRKIVFLTQDQIDQQLNALKGNPALRIAVAIMIYAGLRRAEVLWLTKDSLAKDLSYLSIINRTDEEDIESSLKTGERSVTILPPLRKILEEYLPNLKGKWIVPARDGGRWEPNAFSRRVRETNKRSNIRWTCLHYRHTFATQRAAEGWSLFRIAKEMGNSVAVVEEYYAGFIRPELPSLSAAAENKGYHLDSV